MPALLQSRLLIIRKLFFTLGAQEDFEDVHLYCQMGLISSRKCCYRSDRSYGLEGARSTAEIVMVKTAPLGIPLIRDQSIDPA
jgi:hypothetical protein